MTDDLLREVIARIIASRAFRTVEERLADTADWSQRIKLQAPDYDVDEAALKMARDNFDDDEPVRADALAKADAILAFATPRPAETGEVIQADRDAAAWLYTSGLINAGSADANDKTAAVIAAGEEDGRTTVQAFKNHRLAFASPTPEPVAWRTEYRDVYNGYDTGWRHHYHSTKPHPAPLTSDGCGHRNVTPLYAAPEPSGAVVEALPIVERCARVAEDMILYTGWDVASAIRAIDNEGSEAGSDRLREAKRRLALTQGCLDCNADDEQFWRRVIAFLEEVA